MSDIYNRESSRRAEELGESFGVFLGVLWKGARDGLIAAACLKYLGLLLT